MRRHLPALITLSPAWITPLPDNAFPNKLAHNVPNKRPWSLRIDQGWLGFHELPKTRGISGDSLTNSTTALSKATQVVNDTWVWVVCYLLGK